MPGIHSSPKKGPIRRHDLVLKSLGQGVEIQLIVNSARLHPEVKHVALIRKDAIGLISNVLRAVQYGEGVMVANLIGAVGWRPFWEMSFKPKETLGQV